MATYTTETVLDIRHWNDRLFSFRTTRPTSLRFENGQFVMLGLQLPDRKIVRAYSIASSNHEEFLDFYSIKVPDGVLTSRLQQVQRGDGILISAKPTGTLVLRDLRPGRRLFLLATGTGIAPFLSIVKDPDAYELFEEVIVVHGVRLRSDLGYADSVLGSLRDDPYLGEWVRAKLLHYACVSREPSGHRGRVTTALVSGRLCDDLGIGSLDARRDRLMVCGNLDMLTDTCRFLDAAGFEASPQIGVSGDYVIERAFAESLSRKVAA